MLGYDKNTDLISCKPKKIFENVKYIAAGGYNMAVITEKNNLYLWEIIPMDNWVTERRLVGILEILIKNVGLNLKSNGRCGNCSYRKRKNYCYQNGWQQMGYRNRIWK